jgi:hypothetical protein
MKPAGLAVIAISLFIPLAVASAEDAAKDATKTTATRPAKDHPQETTMPNNAPPATRTETTGSTSQDPTVQKMNADEKKKLEIEGK